MVFKLRLCHVQNPGQSWGLGSQPGNVVGGSPLRIVLSYNSCTDVLHSYLCPESAKRGTPMDAYMLVVRALSPPSPEQVKSFVDYVAGAHSWYKHLPLVPPGTPFYFFLDPYAGYDLVYKKGRTGYCEREEQGFHYSDIPTAEYRQRYGFLQYSTGAGTDVFVPESKGVLLVSSSRTPVSVSAGPRIWARIKARFLSLTGFRPAGIPADLDALVHAVESGESRGPTIQSAERGQVSVPSEILAAGRVVLTGIIHPLASTTWVWKGRAPGVERASSRWPAETGGPETALKILRILQDTPGLGSFETQTGPDSEAMIGFHPEIHNLVDPERRRLKRLMEEAIYRVTHIVYG